VVTRWLLAVLILAACGGTQPVAHAPTPHAPGALGDTWIGHGSSWRQIGGVHPSPRYAASLAFDAERQDFVLFGGQAGSASYGDTWIFDGRAWKLKTPAHKPAARRDAAIAYDPSRRAVVLYGGLVSDSAEGHETSDTWSWDGSDWNKVSDDNSGPRFRYGAGMVTAATHVVLFGGHVFNTEYFGDAWTLAGSTWARLDYGPAPAGRGNAAVAWNEDDSSLFVYGGLGMRAGSGPGNLGVPLTDAWSLKAGAWSQVSSAGPPALYDASAVWDPAAHSVLVMLGMSCPQPVNDAWAWNGSTWTQSKLSIPARWGAATAADAKGDVLVFGGDDEAGC
jgi:hypothetical protein